MNAAANVAAIDALLPQTQCTRCGYPSCREYAQAIARDDAGINQCPPGGTETILALSTLTGRAVTPLNKDNGLEHAPKLAYIDEARCIGCTKCLPPCPVDAIVGSRQRMHTVVASCARVRAVRCALPRGLHHHDPVAGESVAHAHAATGRCQPRAFRSPQRAHRSPRGRAGRGAGGEKTRCQTPVHADKRRQIYARLRAANPAPSTELEYSTPFELLVAVILSAQATDKSVNAVTRKLYPVARTPRAIADLGVEGVAKFIRTIGLWQAKAKNVVATASAIADEHGGQVPHSREALEALPGVGRKTANVVLNTIFGEPTIAVDTHIFRVANRNQDRGR